MDRAGTEALYAIADPTRLRLLAALLERGDDAPPATVERLAERTGIEPRRVERARRQLDVAGLVEPDSLVADLGVLVATLEAAVRERPLERALRPGSKLRGLVRRGVLVETPTRYGVQRELAETLVRAIAPFEQVTEARLNSTLLDMGDDAPVLRRLLVDHGWFSRDPATQVYRPTAAARAVWAAHLGETP